MVTWPDGTWTQDNGRFLGTSRERGGSPYISQSRRGMLVAIQEDQAGVLGLQRLHLKYYR